MGTPDTRDDSANVVADELYDALDGMAPPSLTFGVGRISTVDVDELSPAERALTNTMLPSRLAECASGRFLLHDLIETADPIVRASDGAPLLPGPLAAFVMKEARTGRGADVAARCSSTTSSLPAQPARPIPSGLR